MEYKKIQKIISQVLQLDLSEITDDADLVSDLGADSLEIFQIITEIEKEFEGQGYGAFKPKVGEAVIETLRPIREEATRLLKDKAYLESVYRNGAKRASYEAEKTLRKVYKKVGFLAR